MSGRPSRLRYLLLPLLLALPAAGQAQVPTRAEATAALAPAPRYSIEQLDQMLAPIALYPDQLLVTVLMAATYPDQVADAAQWLKQPANAALQGADLVGALAPLPWDASVKSLVVFPQVVAMLNAYPDWTEAIGLAFADQQELVMARVQALRLQAWNAGQLRQAPHLRIVRQGPIIVIEPAETDVVYVPLYNPAVVYGRWAYDNYPPIYLAPPPGFAGYPPAAALVAWIGFGVGHPIAAPLWAWSHPNWRERQVTIDATLFGRITPNRPLPPGGVWRHPQPVRITRPAPARPAAEAQHPPGTAAATAVVVLRPGAPAPTPAKPAPVVHPGPIAPPAPAPVMRPGPPVFDHKPPPVARPALPTILRPAPPAVLHPEPPRSLHPTTPPVAHPAPPPIHPPPRIVHPTPPPIVHRPPPPIAPAQKPPPGPPKND